MPSTPDGEQYCVGDVDRDQRRPLLQERARRRLHDVHRRVGEREHPRQGAARQALSVSLLHPRGRHAVVPRARSTTAWRARSSPTYGGWGGRYVWRQPYGESRPIWTQGGDSYPGRDNSRDTVVGVDGKTYTSDQATIWRWRDGVPARLRRAHGLDDQERGGRESQSGRRRERPAPARRRSRSTRASERPSCSMPPGRAIPTATR